MKLIDAINLNHLRIFEQVFKHANMTKAAEDLHMTQPGVSQQIKTLENQLGRQLFHRVNKKLVPTEAANILYEKCSMGLNVLEQTLYILSRSTDELCGTVRIGVPDEFGHHFIMPVVQDFLIKHPNVTVHCRFGLREDLEKLVDLGEIDFAVIEDIPDSNRYETLDFFTEKTLLVAHTSYIKNKKIENTEKFYRQLSYICYSAWRPYLNRWHSHHLGSQLSALSVRAVAQTPTAVLSLVRAGLGVGIVPDHLLEAKKIKDVVILEGCGKPLEYRLCFIKLLGRPSTKAAFVLQDVIHQTLTRE